MEPGKYADVGPQAASAAALQRAVVLLLLRPLSSSVESLEEYYSLAGR